MKAIRFQLSFAVAFVAALSLLGSVATMEQAAAPTQAPAPASTIALPQGDRLTNAGRHLVAVSPDGTRLVYAANDRLYLQSLNGGDATPIAGVGGADGARPANPFYSPDGGWIGFWQDRQLKKISLTGGMPVVLCAVQNPRGASWATDNTILFGQGADGIWRVAAEGGTPEQVVRVENGQVAYGPQLLPGGRSILFTLARGNGADAEQIVVQSLENGSRRVVLDQASDARYAATGHLVYARDSRLFALPFDVRTLAATGPLVPVVDDVARAPTGIAQFAISSSGALVYVPADALEASPVRTLVWVDRQGREEPFEAPTRRYLTPRLSPDGTRVALEIDNDIWVFDRTRKTFTRVTADSTFDMVPIWTPDGRDVIFSSGRSGRSTVDALNLVRRAADGTGRVDRLTDVATARQVPYAVTPDGTRLIFREHNATPGGDAGDLMVMSLIGTRLSEPLVQTKSREMNAELSPDGRWFAYQSDESGRDEIYVRPFPNASAGKWKVSSSGGTRPLWARSGDELFYESAGALMRVAVTRGPLFEARTPTRLFDGPYVYGALERMYDISPDGQRFLLIKESHASTEPSLSPRLIVFKDLLKRL
jgi:eukaryotic-like serine/threonine-protein kinase